jgi:putative SbcD/Mre11-related phosphoesterase
MVTGGMMLEVGEPGGWWMTPEGGLIHARGRVAVVADVHLGYDWARARGGDVVPPHALGETRDKLGRLLDRAAVERLIVAGDLVESPRFCPNTARDVTALRSWLDRRGVGLELVAGNHDPPGMAAGVMSVELEGWTIAHGHRAVDGPRLIVGHWHPVARLAGQTAPCFLVEADRVVLPAFSANAAGIDVVGTCPAGIAAASARCVVVAGSGLLDFGPVGELAAAVQGAGRLASRR